MHPPQWQYYFTRFDVTQQQYHLFIGTIQLSIYRHNIVIRVHNYYYILYVVYARCSAIEFFFFFLTTSLLLWNVPFLRHSCAWHYYNPRFIWTSDNVSERLWENNNIPNTWIIKYIVIYVICFSNVVSQHIIWSR